MGVKILLHILRKARCLINTRKIKFQSKGYFSGEPKAEI